MVRHNFDSTFFISSKLDGIVDSVIMESAAENYDITWNNFESRLSRSFADIYSREQFLDVTLAAEAEDGSIQALRAHKVWSWVNSTSMIQYF